jgi:hypothetical protein
MVAGEVYVSNFCANSNSDNLDKLFNDPLAPPCIQRVNSTYKFWHVDNRTLVVVDVGKLCPLSCESLRSIDHGP